MKFALCFLWVISAKMKNFPPISNLLSLLRHEQGVRICQGLKLLSSFCVWDVVCLDPYFLCFLGSCKICVSDCHRTKCFINIDEILIIALLGSCVSLVYFCLADVSVVELSPIETYELTYSSTVTS